MGRLKLELSEKFAADCFWPIAEVQLATIDDSNHYITAAHGSAATVRFGPKWLSVATYQVRIPYHSKTEILKTPFTLSCLNI